MECVSCGQDFPFMDMIFASVRPGDTKRYRCWKCYDRLARYIDDEAKYIDPDHYGGVSVRPMGASQVIEDDYAGYDDGDYDDGDDYSW